MSDPIGDPLDDEENALVKLTSLVVLGLGLTSLFLGFEWFWLVFVVGFAVVVPIVKVVTDELLGDSPTAGTAAERDRQTSGADRRTADRERWTDPDGGPESARDALDTLRERYARGDLSEAEFERKVENLLGTETPESARRHVERGGDGPERDDGRGIADADLETDERAR